jgi:hypothetical protein
MVVTAILEGHGERAPVSGHFAIEGDMPHEAPTGEKTVAELSRELDRDESRGHPLL